MTSLSSEGHRHRGCYSPIVVQQLIAIRIFPDASRLLAHQNSCVDKSSALLRPYRCDPPCPGLRLIPAMSVIDKEKPPCNASHNSSQPPAASFATSARSSVTSSARVNSASSSQSRSRSSSRSKYRSRAVEIGVPEHGPLRWPNYYRLERLMRRPC